MIPHKRSAFDSLEALSNKLKLQIAQLEFRIIKYREFRVQ